MTEKKEKFISLKNDFAFKELMHNETIRKYFISAVLGIPLEEIRSVQLENTFLSKLSRKDKLGILDVRVLFNNESKIDIELQIRCINCWDKRSLFYLTKMYTEGFSSGEQYSKLKKCIVIGILDFAADPHPGYHKVHQLRDQEGRLYSDLLELHIIELNKKLMGDRLDDWIRLINVKNMEELEMIKSKNPGIIMAIERLKHMNMSKWMKAWYDMRLKEWRDQKAYEETAMEIGKEKGLAEGDLMRSKQCILDLLEELGQIPLDIRSRITAEEDIETLRKWHMAAYRSKDFDAFRSNMTELP